jgi:hypothetical protein
MAPLPPPDGEKSLNGPFGGSTTSGGELAQFRAKFNVDLSQMSKLITGFQSLKDKIKAVETAATSATSKVNSLSNALQGVTGGSAGLNVSAPSNGTTSTGTAVSQAIASSKASVVPKTGSSPVAQAGMMGGSGSGFFSNMRGAAFPSGTGGGAGMAQVAQYGMQAIGAGINAIDNRTNQMYGRALRTDQLAVLYQQTEGISQQGYYDQYRKPLQGFRLGADGTNQLLSLQAQTGINAQKQAGSIQGLSAALGYSYSTQDFASMLTTLANPMVNNRMTMTLGTGLYGPGGKQRSMTEVFQGVVRGSGLTNERYLAGAMQQGSSARARLTQLGLPEDMQNAVLQYAKDNVTFQKKTGGNQGMYNPELKSQREIMGIEKNFATQQQETTRKQEVKDEKFYNRQKDNLASMETNTQKMIELTTRIQELTSAITGARISSRGNPITRIGGSLLKKGLGAGIIAASGIGTVLSGGTATPLTLGTAAFGASLLLGDGTETASGKKSASATKGKVTSGSSSGLNDKFRQRLEQMIEASGGKVGIGGGFRSSAQQRSLFLSRYSRTSDKTGTFWDGAYWKKNSGVADAAPPGMSMHEIGLAADLTGDLNWVQENAAKYGLKTFANVNNEPWHVQPAELPNSRRQYEKAGAPWGTIAGAERMDPNATFEGASSDGGVSDALYNSTGSGNVNAYSQMGMSAQMEAFKVGSRKLGGGGGGGRMATGRRTRNVGSASTSTQQSGSVTTGKAMDPRAIAQMLLNRGFKKEDIWKMLAISHRESRWIPSVRNVGPVDDSYGLFQINMKGNLGEARRKYFGIADDSELFDPKTNVKAARITYGGGNLSPWNVKGDWKNGIAPDKMAQSKQIAQSMNLPTTGDPTTPSRGGGNTTVVQGGGVTIAPNIYIQSTGSNTADAKRAAQEVANLITQDLKRTAMRNL